MGGVDLWQNEEEHDDEFDPQSMHDKMLEVVGICGAWHLGKLQVSTRYSLVHICIHTHKCMYACIDRCRYTYAYEYAYRYGCGCRYIY
jgi:hypothetical protein